MTLLNQAEDNFTTTVTAYVTSSATTIPVAKLPNRTTGYLTVFNFDGTQREKIKYTHAGTPGAAGNLVSCLRGLKFTDSDDVEVAGNKTNLSPGMKISLTVSIHYINDLIRIFNGLDEVPANFDMGQHRVVDMAEPVDDTDAATKKFVVDTAAGVGVSYNRIVEAGIAGEVVAAGNLVYLKESDGRWWKCDADTAATVDNIILGIAQGAGTAGVAITGGVLTYGIDTNQVGLTANSIAYAGNTAGQIVSTTPGTVEVTLGYSTATTNVFFNPRYNQQITENQQDALAGNGGIPATANLYVTQQGMQEASETYGEDAGADDTYVIALSPVLSAYTDGQVVRLEATTANTGACTLDAGGGAKSIKKYSNAGIQELDSSDIQAGQVVMLIFSTANDCWILPNAPSNSTIRNFTSGAAYAAKAALYLKSSDGKVYGSDSDAAESSFAFIGFAKEAASGADETRAVIVEGIVAGLAGLTAGSTYFTQAAAGTIGTTPGTFAMKVGRAISTTELWIERGEKRILGVLDLSGGQLINASSNYDTAVTTGFRPRMIKVWGTASRSNTSVTPVHGASLTWNGAAPRGSQHNMAPSIWVDNGGGTYQGCNANETGNISDQTDRLLGSDIEAGAGRADLYIALVTETGFTLRWTNDEGSAFSVYSKILYEVTG